MKKAISILFACILSAALCIGLTGCGEPEEKKAFYTLEEAYENGLITYEDLEEIYRIRNDGEGSLELSANEEKTICQSFFDNFQIIIQEDEVYGPEIDKPEDVEVVQFDGLYHGYYVVTITWFYSPITALSRHEIADFVFYTHPSEYIFVWTNPTGQEI